MTFIVNILHKDFSIISSDRRASTEGPTTIQVDRITIHAEQGTTIQGFKKLFLSKDMTVALGMSGSANEHRYTGEFENTDHILPALALIRLNMEHFLLQDYTSLALNDSFVNNEVIATYCSPETGSFFSNVFQFSPIHNCTRLYMGTDKARLIYVGSGSNIYDSHPQLEKLRQSFPEDEPLNNIQSYLDWIKQTYRAVGACDEHTSEEMVVFFATQRDPLFVEVSEG